ncbi:MAG: YcxB family protein [Mucilaginibacter sp.]|uniref:YcxB family protein n=1 Tax=Mucilaginibacter sp. TaxID=1882438 RepID=UPI00326681B6
MEALIINSQLTAQQYQNINIHFMWLRVRWILAIAIVFLLICFFSVPAAQRGDSVLLWAAGIFFVYVPLFPVLSYFKSGKEYKKNTSMGEKKEYVFNDENIQINGETTNMTMDWKHVNKVKERSKDFIILAFNNKSMICLPKSNFNANELSAFKGIIKDKGVKNDLKP